MKARVKSTGEIIEISESSTIYDASLCHIYNASELENVPDINPNYWTRLEHQYAGMAMQGILSNANHALWHRENNAEVIAKSASTIAHALLEKYKKEEK